MTATVPNKYCFEQAQKLYPGRKRGFQPEWDDFVKRHRQRINEICPLLKPAIEKQIACRATTKDWCPPWKNFKTWLYGSWWTEEIPQTKGPKPRRCMICGAAGTVVWVDGKGGHCGRSECRAKYELL